MHLYQAVIIVMLILIPVITRRNEEVLSIAILHIASIAMFYLISDEHYNDYYDVMILLCLISGAVLYPRFKIAAICSYILVLVNALGLFLWYKYYPHDLYNVISAIIFIIQFLSTLPKALFNGMDSRSNRYSVDSDGCFDGNKTYVTMHKTSQTKEDQR